MSATLATKPLAARGSVTEHDQPRVSGMTLEQRLARTWQAVRAGRPAECPVCGRRMRAATGRGKCDCCGSRLC